jgi:hypothetical protein
MNLKTTEMKTMEMKTIINMFRQSVIVVLFLCSAYAKAQNPNDSLTVQVSNSWFSQDTIGANKNNSTLMFTLNIKEVDHLKSFSLNLIDKDGKRVVDLGKYELRKHENGFYYVTSASMGKKTVLNGDVYFSAILKPDQLAQIKNIKLDYESKSDHLKTVLAALPNK